MKFTTHLLISLTIATLAVVSACTRYPSSDEIQKSPEAKTPQQQVGEGTVDGGGGGNKICGRPIEAFRKDIRELPEYKKYIDPILQYFASTAYPDCKNCEIHNFALGAHIFHMINNKGWYIVPCPIDQISKEKVGSIYDTEQVAVQTFDDVWVDQDKFNSLSEEDRGLMILHEVVMGIKILKFDSTAQQCEVLVPDDKTYCSEIYQTKRKSLDKLSTTDYKDVRIVTNELFYNYKKFDIKTTESNPDPKEGLSSNAMMRDHNFSNSYHIWKRKESNVPVVTGTNLVQALTRSKLTYNMPKYSNHKALDKSTIVAGSKCELDFNYDQIGAKLAMIFKTTSLDGKVTEMEFQKDFKLAKDTVLSGNFLDRIENGNLQTYVEYTLPLEFAHSIDDSLKVGDHSYRIFLQFDTANILHAWEIIESVCTGEINGKCSSSSSVNDSKISSLCSKDERIDMPIEDNIK
jgi:hypothetical protein